MLYSLLGFAIILLIIWLIIIADKEAEKPKSKIIDISEAPRWPEWPNDGEI